MQHKSPDTPTPFPELNQVLEVLVNSVRDILGTSFIGAYLQGSFAVGDYDQHSDVDYVIAITDELTRDQVQVLQSMHARVYGLEARWAQHLEGSYFPLAVLRDHARSGEKLWYLDNGATALIESDHCNTVVVRWTVREYGVTLAGPPPADLVDPIPVEALRGEILDDISKWGGEILAYPERYNNLFYQGFIVLNFCRMLHDLYKGYPGSKRAGAEWAKANLAPAWSGLIDRTWACRPNPAVSVRTPADPQDYESTLQFVEYIIIESKRYPEGYNHMQHAVEGGR